MKISKYIFGMAVAMTAMFTSCDTDNEGAIYNSDNAGLSFTASVLADVTVPATDPTFEVEIVRSNANEALTGSVSLDGTIDKVPYTGELSATDYSFEPGEYKTTVTVEVTSLEVGKILDLTISIDDADNVSIGGNASTSMSIIKEYNWIVIGKAIFTDYTFSENGTSAEVEIEQNETLPNNYRLVAPYAAVYDDVTAQNINFYLSETGEPLTLDRGFVKLDADMGIGYLMYYDPVNYPAYCNFGKEGNTFYANFCLTPDKSALYLGGYFKFEWTEGYPY